MTIEPFSGLSRPTSDFRNTDLPVPEGPSSTEISPGGSVSVTSLQMFWLPNDLVSPSTSTATPTSVCPSAPLPVSPTRQWRASESSCVPTSRASGRPGSTYWSVTTAGASRLRASRSYCDPSLQLIHGNQPRSPDRWNAAGAALPKEDGPCRCAVVHSPAQAGEGV